MSLTEAAKTYQIPKTTLHDKWNAKYKGEGIGRKPALSNDFEKKIVEFLLTTSSWGFPQSSKDLTKFVSNCLRSQDVKVAQFTDGVTPGRDWVLSFLERHKDKLSGIYPLDRNAVKSKLQFNKMPVTPSNTEIVEFLREQRGISSPQPGTSATCNQLSTQQPAPKRRRVTTKKSTVTPGKPVSDITEEEESDLPEIQSPISPIRTMTKKRN